MALQIPDLYNFGNAQQGIAMQQQSTKYLVDSMANLGKGIAESISLNNARREAEELTPFIQAQYGQGFQDIENGNVAQGLSTVYGVGTQISANPILQRIAQDANQAASFASTAAMRRRLSEMEDNQRLNYEDVRQQNRIELKEMGGGNSMTDSAVQSAERYMLGLVDKINDPESPIDVQRNSAIALQQSIDRMQAAGREVGAFDVNPQLNVLINEKLKPLTDTLNETLAMIQGGKLAPEQRTKLQEGAKELEREIKRIKEFEIKVDANQQQPVQNPMEGEMPVDLSAPGNEDIIPIVPEEQSPQQEQMEVLAAVREGRMTKEQARQLAQERGWQ